MDPNHPNYSQYAPPGGVAPPGAIPPLAYYPQQQPYQGYPPQQQPYQGYPPQQQPYPPQGYPPQQQQYPPQGYPPGPPPLVPHSVEDPNNNNNKQQKNSGAGGPNYVDGPPASSFSGGTPGGAGPSGGPSGVAGIAGAGAAGAVGASTIGGISHHDSGTTGGGSSAAQSAMYVPGAIADTMALIYAAQDVVVDNYDKIRAEVEAALATAMKIVTAMMEYLRVEYSLHLPSIAFPSLPPIVFPSISFMDFYFCVNWAISLTANFGIPSFRIRLPMITARLPHIDFPSLINIPDFDLRWPDGLQIPHVDFEKTREIIERMVRAIIGVVEEQANRIWGILSALFMVKFDIFRDFFQLLALYFAQIQLPEGFRAFFGRFSVIISIDFKVSFPKVSDEAIYWLVFVVAIIFFIIMVIQHKRQPDEERTGNETITWGMFGKNSKRIMQAVVTIVLTMYLPITRNALEIFTCRAKSTPAVGLCASSSYGVYVVTSIISFVLITLFTPFFIYRTIEQNKPKDAVYSSDGRILNASERDQIYQEYLIKDKCPYKFLYEGYERPWAFYKVIAMALKTSVVVPVVALNSQVGKAVSTLILVSITTGMGMYSHPCLKPEDDLMYISSMLVNTFTVAAALLAYKAPRTEGASGVFLNVINTLNLVIIIGATLYTFPFFKRFLKRSLNNVEFSDRKLNYDLRRERKTRIWWTLWDAIILSEEATLGPVRDRLEEEIEIVRKFGLPAYKTELSAISSEEYANRLVALDYFEGIDVFWDGVPKDGRLDSQLLFGKLWIREFPWQVHFVWDDSDDVQRLTAEDVARLININCQPEICRRRHFRYVLRCFNQASVVHPYQEWRTMTVYEGTGENRKARSIRVLLSFHNAVGSVEANTDLEASAGFKFAIHYSDGNGSAEGHSFHGQGCTLGHMHFGIDGNYQWSAELNRLVSNNVQHVTNNYARVIASNFQYRTRLGQKRMSARSILSWGFYYNVYNNDCLTLNGVREWIDKQEHNAALKDAVQRNWAMFEFTSVRLSYYDSHPTIAFWYCFFDDFYKMNRELDAVKKNETWLSPGNPGSICYQPLPRERLVERLKEHGLDRTLNVKHLDMLYNKLDYYANLG